MHQQIINYLTPMLGDATAANLVKHYCLKMRVPLDDIKPGQVRELADAMRPMLAVWLGSTGAARVAQELAELGRGA
jgi:hypothetical protein